ncbi:hypothetical protein SAMN05421734_11123 [Pelagirhabdus alkalitolerans]|uniref:Uncharacterized protein n=1 Tax=Pelagirhabdus alkalitolerans TaxID=1612202 RepID=A0A1G6MHS4_9BACI|nr:NusG domain II-containing protein [Pelagirhabdus alkalitolerans]SDC55083.1 hypothetical protein SAMN05421734_11123 [Pelagirhabdus alkalitolerans]
MKAFIQMLKPGDLFIIVLLLMISFLPLGYFYLQQSGDGDLVAVISLENEEVQEINLSEHEEDTVFDVDTPDGETNTIEVSDGSIRIKSATCSDQVCVRTGFIDQVGQTIVCLPHQLVIEIQSQEPGQQSDVDVISS